MAHTMDRADYYEAKAAILEAAKVQAETQATQQRAWAKAYATLNKLGVTQAGSYTWDDTHLTITPHTGG